MTYEVYVNFAGYIGADEPYNVSADSEEEAVILAEAEAKDDLSVESIENLGDGEYLVTVSFCDFIGVEEEYRVYADNESDAGDQAIEEASWDLSGEVTDTLEELDEGFIGGIGYVDPMTFRHWQEHDDEYERTHPNEELFDTVTDDELIAQGAIRAKDAKVGDLIRHDFSQEERSISNDPELLYDYKITDIYQSDDTPFGPELAIVTDDGQTLHFYADDLMGWRIDPADLPAMRADAAKNDLKKYEGRKNNMVTKCEAYKSLNIAPFRPFRKEDWYGWAGASKIGADEPLIYEDDNATIIISGDEGEPGCAVDVYAGEMGDDAAYSSQASGNTRLSFPKALKLAKEAVKASEAGYEELIYWCDENLEEY